MISDLIFEFAGAIFGFSKPQVARVLVLQGVKDWPLEFATYGRTQPLMASGCPSISTPCSLGMKATLHPQSCR